MRTILILSLFLLAPVAAGITITVEPGDNIAESLLTLSSGDSLFLSPGVYTSSSEQPILTAGPLQSGVTVTSDPDNRAILNGQNIERSVISLSGPHSSAVVFENLVITGGNATGSGAFNGGGISASESNALVSNCMITENTALIGGGIGAEGGTLTLQYSTISNNSALVTGGGLDLYATEFTGFLLKFLSNTSSDDGGGLNAYQSTLTLSSSLFTGNYSGDDGGAITVLQGSSNFSFLTIYSNEAYDDGGGMRLHTIDSVSVESSIITSNNGNGGINLISTNIPFFSHVCCWDNAGENYKGMPDPTGTNGNISEDPLFADTELNISQTAAGQTENSPALNSGHTSVEQTAVNDFSTRTDSLEDTGIADMGFHHLSSSQTGVSPSPAGETARLVLTPSPAVNVVGISLSGEVSTPIYLNVYDLTGRLIHSFPAETISADKSWEWFPDDSFRGGLVLFQALWQNGKTSGRVVILK